MTTATMEYSSSSLLHIKNNFLLCILHTTTSILHKLLTEVIYGALQFDVNSLKISLSTVEEEDNPYIQGITVPCDYIPC